MKRGCVILVMIVAVGVILAVWSERERAESRRAPDYVFTVNLTGTPDAAFTGFYMSSGKRCPIHGELPWSFTGTNLTKVEVRTVDSSATIAAEARGGPYGGMLLVHRGPGKQRIRLNLSDGGLSCEIVLHDWTVEIGDGRLGLFSPNGSSTALCYGFGSVYVRAPPALVLLAAVIVMSLSLGGLLFVRSRRNGPAHPGGENCDKAPPD